MAEFDSIIPSFEMLLDLPLLKEFEVTFVSTNNDFFPSATGNEFDVTFNFMADNTPTRMQKVYNSYDIIPIYLRMNDGELDEDIIFSKEVREWDMIIVSSEGVQSPRRQPTELIYKGRKMKNQFPTE